MEIGSPFPSMQNTSYLPTQSFLLCLPPKTSEFSAGGIYIPDLARKTLNEATVVAVGELVNTEDYPIGWDVVFARDSEYALKLDGQAYLAVSTENVILKRPPRVSVTLPLPAET